MEANKLPRHLRWDQSVQNFQHSKGAVIFSIAISVAWACLISFIVYSNLSQHNHGDKWKYGLMTLSIFWMLSLLNTVKSYRKWKRATKRNSNSHK